MRRLIQEAGHSSTPIRPVRTVCLACHRSAWMQGRQVGQVSRQAERRAEQIERESKHDNMIKDFCHDALAFDGAIHVDRRRQPPPRRAGVKI